MTPEELAQLSLVNPQQYEINYPDIEEIQSIYGEGLINTKAGSRGNYFSLDPGGIFGTRQAAIEKAAKTYEAGQGFKLGLNEDLGGITQQDVANYYMTQYNKARRLDPSVKEAKKLFPKGQKPNAATPQLQLEQSLDRIKTTRNLTSQIKALDGGPKKLSEAIKNKGGNLTNGELESLLSVSQNETRSAVAGRDLSKANIDSLEQGTQASKDASLINKDTLQLNKDIAQNTDEVNRANLDLNRVIAQNNQINTTNQQATDSYRYEDGKASAALERQFLADREDAKFAANLETVRLQNANEMERYQMMLDNDRSVRRGKDISDLVAALTVLGGSFAV